MSSGPRANWGFHGILFTANSGELESRGANFPALVVGRQRRDFCTSLATDTKVDAPSRCGTRCSLRKLPATNRYFQKNISQSRRIHDLSVPHPATGNQTLKRSTRYNALDRFVSGTRSPAEARKSRLGNALKNQSDLTALREIKKTLQTRIPICW
jgi:hypothetical protein